MVGQRTLRAIAVLLFWRYREQVILDQRLLVRELVPEMLRQGVQRFNL
jgi:hypothetical protein